MVDFQTYTGTGLHPNPSGSNAGALNSTVFRVQTDNSASTYGATSTNADWSLGLKQANFSFVGTAGGIGAVQLTSAVRGIYLQPSNGAFTPGFVEMRHKYETPGTANLLLNVTVELDLWSINNGAGSSNWTVGYYSGDAHAPNVAGTDDQHFVTVAAASSSPTWVKQSLDFVFLTQYTVGDDYLFVRISGDDAPGSSGNRDTLAISSIGVVAVPVGAAVTTTTTTAAVGATTTTAAVGGTTTTAAGGVTTTAAGGETTTAAVGGETTTAVVGASTTAAVGGTSAAAATTKAAASNETTSGASTFAVGAAAALAAMAAAAAL